MRSAADDQRDLPAGEYKHGRLDHAGCRAGGRAVGLFKGGQIVLSLLVVLQLRLVHVEFTIANQLEEVALDNPPPLQVARLEVEDHLPRVLGKGNARQGKADKRGDQE